MTATDVGFVFAGATLLACAFAMQASRSREKHSSWIYGSFFGALTALLLAEPIYYSLDAAMGGLNFLALIQRAFLALSLLSMHIGVWRAIAPNRMARQILVASVVAGISYGGQVLLFFQASASITSSGMRQYESNPTVAAYSLLMLAHLATVAYSAMQLGIRYRPLVRSSRRRTSLALVSIGSGLAMIVAALHGVSAFSAVIGVQTAFLIALERICAASAALVFAVAICVPTFPRWLATARKGCIGRRDVWRICPIWKKLRPEVEQYVIWPYRGRVLETLSRNPTMRAHRRVVEVQDCFESDRSLEGRLSEAERATIQRMESNTHA